ncbi:unnamed protein product [Zymoseptoria tritici ST99CH_3D7]|uniref:Uncharacterized protein n=1 Tax=Zymoseptoria tritici (strain ST99CH_3D7) TaxID=1276538 RepID=A0A1X7RVN4_ZYMT9|nr:unnamed protein product [Zymoseptoria tritici ST99CH_3D7]
MISVSTSIQLITKDAFANSIYAASSRLSLRPGWHTVLLLLAERLRTFSVSSAAPLTMLSAASTPSMNEWSWLPTSYLQLPKRPREYMSRSFNLGRS